jgi:selenocysteine-specific elongation factor
MRVIGTAGHVDHGKSTLIEALTGIHPDRLQEEREREMTIVLGFAWLTLPGGLEIGIVDVPGHRDFIENMLSGIGAIDAALFVVAADEGVMPQTLEHLAILDLLQIQGGVIAITKIDAVAESEWVDLVEVDILETVAGTSLEGAPLVRVSAKTGEGISKLQEILEDVLADTPERPDLGRPRLPVDRVFTMPGFGTVVTGTLSDGHLNVGDNIVILPSQIRGRIRGLQTHKRKEQTALTGSRTAVNISGVDVDQVQRGDVVSHQGDYISTRRMDVHIRLLNEINDPIKHNLEVKLFIGASEVIARLRLLGSDILKPGQEGWLQLELAHPVVAIRGDRYILRRPSPGETLGGGVVVDPSPIGRHKRFDDSILSRLKSLVGGSPAEVLLQSVLTAGLIPIRAAVQLSSLDREAGDKALIELIDSKTVKLLNDNSESVDPNLLITTKSYWTQIQGRITKEIKSYQKSYPLRLGIPREMLKSRLNLSPREFNDVISEIISEGSFCETYIRHDLPGLSPVPVIHQPGQKILFSTEQQSLIDTLIDKFASEPYAPPTIKTCITEAGEDIYNALVDLGKLIPVSEEVVFRWDDYQGMVTKVHEIIAERGTVSVAQVRDRLKTSRRYVLAFLEHLDAIGVTVRKGDVRKLKN